MSITFTAEGAMVTLECDECGVRFAMTQEFYDKRRRDHKIFYCPSGHRRYFSGPSEEEKLRKELINANNRSDYYKGEYNEQRAIIRQKDRQVAAHKGVSNRRKKQLDRVSKGVCPCCKRSFKNLHRHMKGQHPDFVKEK